MFERACLSDVCKAPPKRSIRQAQAQTRGGLRLVRFGRETEAHAVERFSIECMASRFTTEAQRATEDAQRLEGLSTSLCAFSVLSVSAVVSSSLYPLNGRQRLN
jgi:hypothetical protein